MKKKNSAMKKLIPATSMLLVSATMLATSTYAWFTMSKEVEVTGIKLTASVPESLEISLGYGTKTPLVTSFSGLKKDDGGSVVAVGGTNVKYTDIKAPDETANTTDFANTVDFSEHYVAGRLIPASSTDGRYIFKTSDATGVGKTVADGAAFYNVNDTEVVGLHALTADNDTTYSTDVTPNSNIQDDKLAQGYYIDFPIWIRTSSKTVTSGVGGVTGLTTSGTPGTLDLGVKATITQRSATETDDNLYHAVRIAVLPTSNGSVSLTSKGVISDLTTESNSNYYDRYTSSATDFSDTVSRQSVYSQGVLRYNPNDGTTSVASVFGAADIIGQAKTKDSDGLYTDGEVVVQVPLATTDKYGAAVKYVVRLWIEGEDKNCWNETAGQDFNVALQFVKLNNTATDHKELLSTSATSDTVENQDTNIRASVNNGTAPAFTPASSIAVTYGTGGAVTQTYTYDNNNKTYNYNHTPGTGHTLAQDFPICALLNSTDPTDGRKTYKSGDDKTFFANEEDLIAYLDNYGGIYDFSNGLTLESVS